MATVGCLCRFACTMRLACLLPITSDECVISNHPTSTPIVALSPFGIISARNVVPFLGAAVAQSENMNEFSIGL
jgi:hypothetical protein